MDRFLALQYDMRYPTLMTERRALYTSGTIWFTCLLLSCIYFWTKKKLYLAFIVFVAICIQISTYSYIRIYFIVRRHRLKIRVQQEAVESLNVEHNMNMVQSKKTARNTFIYYICMILCYSPAFISMLTLAISPALGGNKAWNLADTVVFMNSSINPFLYYWRTRELRTVVLKTLRDILFKQSEET